jgi:hypothetical protein
MARGVAQVNEYLPSKHKDLSSNPSTTKEEKLISVKSLPTNQAGKRYLLLAKTHQ